MMKILHPTDFSPASRAAFARAVRDVRASRAQLLILHVLSSVTPLAGDEPSSARRAPGTPTSS
jgi:nucleotide-binding universal stress UspA family protein